MIVIIRKKTKMMKFTIFFVIIAVVRSSKVPALIWSESRSMSHFPQASLGNTIHTKEFTQKYLSPLTSEKDSNLVVFLQDKLSLQDITNHADVYNYNGDGGVFKNIKGYMDDHFSVQLPSVSSPGDGIENLKKKFQGKVHEVSDPSEIDNLDFGSGQMNLIIVTLTPVKGASHEEEVFQKNDDSIGMVVHKLSKRNLKYSAVYTAKSSVQVDSKSPNLKRHLLQVTEIDNGTFINVSNCMYFYVKSLTVTVEPDSVNQAILLNDTSKFIDVNSACTNKTAVLNLEYKHPDGYEFTLRFDISDHNTTQWNITQAIVTVKGNVNGTDIDGKAYMDTRMIWAPKDYSYHCLKLGPIRNFVSNDSTVNVSLTFDKFQFQPFNIHFNMFSDGWDCVVFFTEGIWMGIFSAIFMILILMYGLSMVADIKTMDKFDDAKGKTITVNVSD